VFETVPTTQDLRPSWLRAGASVLVIAAGLVFMFAMLATADATQTEPGVSPHELAAPAPAVPAIGAWTMPAEAVARTGFRRGQRSAIEVVALGPDRVEVEIRTAKAFLAMRSAAARGGVALKLESGFRTHQHQTRLFRAWRKGQRMRAARPGRSNHQSGRALDIAVKTVPGAGEWLESNAARFGFKRTVAKEPWHWEYVEAPRARKKIKGKSRLRRSKRSRRSAKAKKKKRRRRR